jgi:membrane-bound serine protease (ClpP class)
MFWPILLFALGIGLIVLEFVLPGAICGISGAVLLVISTWLGISEYPDHALLIVFGEFIGAGLGIAAGLVLLSSSSSAIGLSLDTNLTEELGYTNLASNTNLIGTTGTVMTALRPSGTIVLENGERVDAVSDGNFIEDGQQVIIIEVHGNRVVVERA